jgi:hypothetical protein
VTTERPGIFIIQTLRDNHSDAHDLTWRESRVDASTLYQPVRRAPELIIGSRTGGGSRGGSARPVIGMTLQDGLGSVKLLR